jgi:hypothetical protein
LRRDNASERQKEEIATRHKGFRQAVVANAKFAAVNERASRYERKRVKRHHMVRAKSLAPSGESLANRLTNWFPHCHLDRMPLTIVKADSFHSTIAL